MMPQRLDTLTNRQAIILQMSCFSGPVPRSSPIGAATPTLLSEGAYVTTTGIERICDGRALMLNIQSEAK